VTEHLTQTVLHRYMDWERWYQHTCSNYCLLFKKNRLEFW